jgi:hypothetical protein
MPWQYLHFLFDLRILRLFLNTCIDVRFSRNIFLFRFGVFAQCEIGQSRRHYYPMQGVTELWLKNQSEIRPMHESIFESPKSGDRFGRKNRRAGIELFCFNFYSPLHLTVQCMRSKGGVPKQALTSARHMARILPCLPLLLVTSLKL